MQAKDDPATAPAGSDDARAVAPPETAPAGSDDARAIAPPKMPTVDVEGPLETRCVEGSKEGPRPLLLVDIDGVISLFPGNPGTAPFSGEARATRPGQPPAFAAEEGRQGSFHTIEGIPHFLSATAAEHLLTLAEHYELVWASGWEEKANEHLPHLLGLPRMEHLSFERRVGKANAHWKLDAIEAHAGERALAWIDDAFNDACHAWAHARAAPTLLVQTQPAAGLTQREADTLRLWAGTLERGRRATPGGYVGARGSRGNPATEPTPLRPSF